jgi:propanediol dehydratase small subunit
MTAKEQLLQELSSVPDNLIVETLNFVRFLKTKERSSLAAAAEMMRDFYAEGGKLTEFSDLANEDFYEYENYA